MSLEELRPHLFSMPDRPDWIPYRTSYYSDNWGFCLPDRVVQQLPEGEYEVVVDTELADGSLTYGELLVPGAEGNEVLISTHTCHPAMANDNTTGIVLAMALAQWALQEPRRYSYRFLFIPGTIGSLTWLQRNDDVVGRIAHGLVLTGLGDAGGFSYKRSRRGDAVIDRAVARVLADREAPHRLMDFSPYGYDERQFCSPGYNLPVGRLGRAQHGEYPEYHTSADDLSYVSLQALGEAYDVLVDVLGVLERDRTYVNLNPRGEPQLGRRGLYRALGATMNAKAAEMALLWVLNLADGKHSLLDMSARSGTDFSEIAHAADLLIAADLLAPA
jgi:aminopeptidase-like protein